MSKTGFSPVAVDLFAGCGGISEGFISAGYRVLAYLEKDHSACETLRTRIMFNELMRLGKPKWYRRYFYDQISRENICRKFNEVSDSIDCRVIEREFGEHRYADLISAIRNTLKVQGASRVHVLLGGPPCQAYSLVGRSRDPHRMERDERRFLYQHYLSVLVDLQPDFFVLENVPGLLSAKAEGEETLQRILRDFAAIEPAYEIAPSYEEFRSDPYSYLIDSSCFNVPQRRRRVLLIGYRRALAREHPSVQAMFKKLLDLQILNRRRGILTVEDAIGDLPRLKPGSGKDTWLGTYDRNDDLKPYQIQMRNGSPGVCNHKARTHMTSDLERYKFFILFHKNGNHAATLQDLQKVCPDLMPDHKNIKDFVDRFRVQWFDRPSSTIMSHIAKDGHYYIHPDISQCRSFTVREAARCQSFPDNFRFEGHRTEQFRQVGNAVPPRMAAAIARVLMKELRAIYSTR